jgi:predicted secreted protein
MDVFLKCALILLFERGCFQPVNQKDKPLQVQKNSVFKIRLKCAAGAGYSWQLIDTAAIVKFERQTFEPAGNAAPGSDGYQIFYFKAKQTGQTTINLRYVRPFLKSSFENAEKKSIKVSINK